MSISVIILTIIVLTLIVGVLAYNEMVRRQNYVSEADSGIHVQLKKRYDLIPNLVNAVKKYMQHEAGLLEKVTALRVKALGLKNGDHEAGAVNNEISRTIGGIMVAVENYPDLKASTNFSELQQSLNEVEAQIAAARRNYNNSVVRFNNIIKIFPMNLLASQCGFTPCDFLEFESVSFENPDLAKLFDK